MDPLEQARHRTTVARCQLGDRQALEELFVCHNPRLGYWCLPAVAMLPWLLMFLGRRSASMGQVRTSLASIEAQLNLLSRSSGTPTSDPPSPARG